MAGIRQIGKEIHAKCPHCHRSLDLTEVGVELFRRILVKLSKGERVDVERFGSFRVKLRAAQKVEGMQGGISVFPAYARIIFRAYPGAKEALQVITKEKDKEDTDG